MKSIREGFPNSDAGLEPPNLNPDISTTIQQTLDRLMAFNETQKRFLLLNCDEDGRLLISSSTTNTNTANVSRVAMSGSTQLALAQNGSRRAYRLINRSASSVKVGFVTPIASAYFTLDANGTYYDDIYSGNVYIQGTASEIVEVVEF